MPSDPPSYIFFGGAGVPPPPYTCGGGQFTSFVCLGEETAIQGFIDRTLNAAIGSSRYRAALGPAVFLFHLELQSVGSAVAPFSNFGTMSETDIGFWLLVRDTSRPATFFWFAAYLYVDNWMALIGGREVWGFPKALATISRSDATLAATIEVSVLAMKTEAPGSHAAPAMIFTIAPAQEAGHDQFAIIGLQLLQAGHDELAVIGVEVHQLVQEHAQHPSHPAWAVEQLARLSDILDPATPDTSARGGMLFLKQLRDADSSVATCYQAVIAAEATLSGPLRGLTLVPGAFVLSLADYASQPIARDLGLAVGNQPLIPLLSANVDFVMGFGTPVAT